VACLTLPAFDQDRALRSLNGIHATSGYISGIGSQSKCSGSGSLPEGNIVIATKGKGNGSDIPAYICIQSPYSGDYSKVRVSWTTRKASDSFAQIMLPGAGDGPSFSQFCPYSATLTTSHSVVCSNIVATAGTHGITVASCSAGPGCSRVSSHWSATPGTTDPSGFPWTPAKPDADHSFSFTIAVTRPPNAHLYAGHSINLPVSGFQIDGPSPAYTKVKAIQIDEKTCTYSVKGGACGTGLTVQFICGNSESMSPATNNYQSLLSDGLPYCYNSPIGYQVNFVRISATASALGSHTLSIREEALNSSNTVMGSATPALYTFEVVATPRFTYLAPTKFGLPPGLSNFNAYLGNYASDMQAFKAANLDNQGQYFNDNFSYFQATYNPDGIFTYGGDSNAIRIADYLSRPVNQGSWESKHHYGFGAIIYVNDRYYVQEVPAGCVSGHKSPKGSSPGENTSDDTCMWGDLETPSWWLAIAQRMGTQLTAYYLALGKYTVWQEWSLFTDGPAMECYRWLGRACRDSLNNRAIAYSLYPFVAAAGAHTNQNVIWGGVAQPTGTIRASPYSVMAWENYGLTGGAWPILDAGSGIDEVKRRLDIYYDIIDELATNCTHTLRVDADYPCGRDTLGYFGPPTYDLALVAKAMSRDYATDSYFKVPPDSMIPVMLGKLLDWEYSYEFNLTGTDDVLPYSMFLAPQAQDSGYESNSGLNAVTMDQYLWYWAVMGDQCILPTSSVSCRTAADQFFSNSFRAPLSPGPISGKVESQWYWGFLDYYNLRTGAKNANELTIMPSQNGYSAIADEMEPFNVGETYPEKPKATAISSSSASIQWYTMEETVSSYVRYCSSSRCDPRGGTAATGGRGSLYDPNIGEYLNRVNVTGLKPNTTYYFGVGAVDSAGNRSWSDFDITIRNPSCCYKFQTAP